MGSVILLQGKWRRWVCPTCHHAMKTLDSAPPTCPRKECPATEYVPFAKWTSARMKPWLS